MLPQGDSYILQRAREDSLIPNPWSKVNFTQFKPARPSSNPRHLFLLFLLFISSTAQEHPVS